MFADHEDVALLLVSAMQKLRHLLPPEVVEPYHRILPTLGECHVANALVLREFRVHARVLDSSRDLLEAWSQRQEAFDEHIRVTARFVVFTPAVYSELRLECGTEAWFLNAHLVGVHLVDSLIRRLCLQDQEEEGIVSAAIPQVARDRLCVEDPYQLEDVSKPQLALRIVKRALGKVEDWHQHYYSWSIWKLSESQLFYERFYMREACAYAARLPPTYLQKSAEMLMSFEDFRKAFGCPAG
ncbi:uncharacterized protein LOC144105292 [Amblyomma americanum]